MNTFGLTINQSFDQNISNTFYNGISGIGKMTGRAIQVVTNLPASMQTHPAVAVGTFLTANALFFAAINYLVNKAEKRIENPGQEAGPLSKDSKYVKAVVLNGTLAGSVIVFNLVLSKLTNYALSAFVLGAIAAAAVAVRYLMPYCKNPSNYMPSCVGNFCWNKKVEKKEEVKVEPKKEEAAPAEAKKEEPVKTEPKVEEQPKVTEEKKAEVQQPVEEKKVVVPAAAEEKKPLAKPDETPAPKVSEVIEKLEDKAKEAAKEESKAAEKKPAEEPEVKAEVKKEEVVEAKKEEVAQPFASLDEAKAKMATLKLRTEADLTEEEKTTLETIKAVDYRHQPSGKQKIDAQSQYADAIASVTAAEQALEKAVADKTTTDLDKLLKNYAEALDNVSKNGKAFIEATK